MKTQEWLNIITIALLIGGPILLSTLFFRHKKNSSKHNSESIKQEEIEQSESRYVLRYPIFYRLVPLGLILMGIFIICVVIVQQDSSEYIWGVLGFLILPGLTMFVCWSLWKVEVRRDSFTYRNFMGITKTYYYADLEWDIAHTGLKWWFFKDGKKVFCMAYFIEDENKLRRIYNKYKQKHRNKDQLNNQN